MEVRGGEHRAGRAGETTAVAAWRQQAGGKTKIGHWGPILYACPHTWALFYKCCKITEASVQRTYYVLSVHQPLKTKRKNKPAFPEGHHSLVG